MPTLPGYYTTQEAAERLGYTNPKTLAKQCAEGRIPAHKVGKTWLIPESWIFEQEKTAPIGKGNRGVSRK